MNRETGPIVERFLGKQNDCSYISDPRRNKELGARLKGKNVVIAGAGRGIGRATAEFFAHTETTTLSMMALELAEINETAEICKAINPKLSVKTAAFNVLDYSSVDGFVQEVIRDFGKIDVLFVNAGRAPQWLPTHESDPAVWWDTLAVSLQGAFNFTRAALPHLREQGGGRIIFTSSAGAHAAAGMGGYVIGKLGQVRLAEIIHNENKDRGIKAFAYHPGAIPTRFFHDFKDASQGKIKENSYVSKDLPGEQKSAMAAVKALEDATFSTPQMPAGLVTVLASGQLDFMSGRYLDASVRIEDYISDEERIRRDDLHRVRLVVDKEKGVFIPEKGD
jgi:NAD(P)-dependent dehydrogenase (short-subunit alcohol dehydrogenase family)